MDKEENQGLIRHEMVREDIAKVISPLEVKFNEISTVHLSARRILIENLIF